MEKKQLSYDHQTRRVLQVVERALGMQLSDEKILEEDGRGRAMSFPIIQSIPRVS